jgi:Flp pilus assembly protein TadD
MSRLLSVLALALLLTGCAGLPLRSSAKSEFDRGLTLFNAGKYEQAVPHFSKATELDPKFHQSFLYLGRSYVNLQRWGDAIPPLRAAYRLAPADTQKEVMNILIDALLSAAAQAMKAGNFQGAIGHLKEGVSLGAPDGRLQSGLAEGLSGFGASLLREGRYPEAVAAFQELVSLAPTRVDAYLGLARSLWKNGQLGEALLAVRKGLAVDPSSGAARSLLSELMNPP